MRLDDVLTNIDKWSSYVPGVSTVTNLVDLFEKAVVIPFIKPEDVGKNHYISHIKRKSLLRTFMLLIPVIGNITVGIYDFTQRKWNDPDYVFNKLQKNVDNLKYASSDLLNDHEFMCMAMFSKPEAVMYTGEVLRNDDDYLYEVDKGGHMHLLNMKPGAQRVDLGGGNISDSDEDYYSAEDENLIL